MDKRDRQKCVDGPRDQKPAHVRWQRHVNKIMKRLKVGVVGVPQKPGQNPSFDCFPQE